QAGGGFRPTARVRGRGLPAFPTHISGEGRVGVTAGLVDVRLLERFVLVFSYGLSRLDSDQGECSMGGRSSSAATTAPPTPSREQLTEGLGEREGLKETWV
ncbi:hypothetical protein DKP78_17445, partial [Enterococcus faecium]